MSDDILPQGVGSNALLDEMEQLRTALESAIEENFRLIQDGERLRQRVTLLTRELRAVPPAPPLETRAALVEQMREQASHTEEELRVAFEELQVLTEELEVANSSLHQANQELDAKVEERTRQLSKTNSALRSAEGSLRAITDLVPDLLWRLDAEGQADWFNRRWLDYTGHELGESFGRQWLQAIHPMDRPTSAAAWEDAVAGEAPFQQELRLRDADGVYRWTLVRAEPMRNESGGTRNWFVAGTDVHERRTAMEALQQSELRFRTLIEGMPQMVWRAVGEGQWTWCSPQWTEYTGQSAAESLGTGWLEMIHPDDRDAALKAWERAQQIGSLDVESRIYCAEKNRHAHFRTRALPVRDEAGIVVEWLGTSTDLDDIWHLRQQQSVLIAELQHRTRNLMAIVRSIANRTITSSQNLEEFRECFDDRMSALARAQSLLSRREGGLRVSFDLLLREELSAHVQLNDSSESQVSLSGPSGVPLRSSIVQTLALAIHELATNAVKYGALSRPGPHLSVTWGLKEDHDGSLLWVDWRESGLKNLDTQGHSRGNGYGRELIERALPYQLGASTSYAIEADGVHCTIEVKLPLEESEEISRD